MPDGREVRLWYQAWPAAAGTSVHATARARYGIAAGPARPDIVIELIHGDIRVDAVLLEIKATQSASYLGQGLLQLLGYLKDRRTLFTNNPAGWLVAPASKAFISAPHGGAELWAIDGKNVAHAALVRFGYAIDSTAN